MYVTAGAGARLREREREAFLTAEWPAIRDRIGLLGIEAADLIESV